MALFSATDTHPPTSLRPVQQALSFHAFMPWRCFFKQATRMSTKRSPRRVIQGGRQRTILRSPEPRPRRAVQLQDEVTRSVGRPGARLLLGAALFGKQTWTERQPWAECPSAVSAVVIGSRSCQTRLTPPLIRVQADFQAVRCARTTLPDLREKRHPGS